MNNNLYYTKNPNKYIININGAKKNVSEVKSSYGWERNGAYGDPMFKEIAYGMSSKSHYNDLRIRDFDSPAIGLGENLYTMFDYDKDNNVRNQKGVWDVGAYTGISNATTDVRSPNNLRILTLHK